MKKYLTTGFSVLVSIFIAQLLFAQSAITFQMSLVDELKSGTFNPATDRVEVRGMLQNGVQLRDLPNNHEIENGSDLDPVHGVNDFGSDSHELATLTDRRGNTQSQHGTTRQVKNPRHHSFATNAATQQSATQKPNHTFQDGSDLSSSALTADESGVDKGSHSLVSSFGQQNKSVRDNNRTLDANLNSSIPQTRNTNDNVNTGDHALDQMNSNNPNPTNNTALDGVIMTEGTIVDSVYNVTIIFPPSLMGEELNYRFAKITSGRESVEQLVAPRIVTLSPGSRALNVSYFNIPSW